MFSNCPKLVGGQGTSWNSDAVDGTYAVIDKAADGGQAGYFTPKIYVTYYEDSSNATTASETYSLPMRAASFEPEIEALADSTLVAGEPIQYVYGIKAKSSENERFLGWGATVEDEEPKYKEGEIILSRLCEHRERGALPCS